MTGDGQVCNCGHCLILELAAAVQARDGYFDQPGIAAAARSLIRAWNNYDDALHAARVALTIGCPSCGSPADSWCMTSSGKPYDLQYGPAYVHAARRHAITDLETPTLELAQDDHQP